MKKEIEFKYKFNSNYNPIYINGTYGGINSKGEIIMNFFLERMPVPYSITQEIDENGNLKDTSIIKKEPDDIDELFIRFVETGIVMNYETAKSVHDWLGIRIKQYEEIMKKGSDQT